MQSGCLKLQVIVHPVMKHQKFYRKFKTHYPPMMSPWNFVIITFIAALLEPFLIYKSFKHVPFSLNYYLNQIEYFSFIGVPLVVFLFWANWREAKKRSLGYCWVGKFEVIDKRATVGFYYLSLTPGVSNMLRVSRNLFKNIRVGDYVIVRRDSLGDVDEVRRINNFLGRVSRARPHIA